MVFFSELELICNDFIHEIRGADLIQIMKIKGFLCRLWFPNNTTLAKKCQCN